MSEFNPYVEWLGIPEPGRPADHYALLGIDRFEDDQEVICRSADAQKSLVRSVRPGQHTAEWGKILDELDAAQKCLTAADEKTIYDGQLRQQPTAEESLLEKQGEQAATAGSAVAAESAEAENDRATPAMDSREPQPGPQPPRNLLPPGAEPPAGDEELFADEAEEADSRPVESMTKNILPPVFSEAAAATAPAGNSPEVSNSEPNPTAAENPAPIANPAPVVEAPADTASASTPLTTPPVNPAPIVEQKPDAANPIAAPGNPAGQLPSVPAPTSSLPPETERPTPNHGTPPTAKAHDDLLPPMAVSGANAGGAAPSPNAVPGAAAENTSAAKQPGTTDAAALEAEAWRELLDEFQQPNQPAASVAYQVPNTPAPGMPNSVQPAAAAGPVPIPVPTPVPTPAPPTGMPVPTGTAVPYGMPSNQPYGLAGTPPPANLAGQQFAGSTASATSGVATEPGPFGTSDPAPVVATDSPKSRKALAPKTTIPASTVVAVTVALLLLGWIVGEKYLLTSPSDEPAVTLAGGEDVPGANNSDTNGQNSRTAPTPHSATSGTKTDGGGLAPIPPPNQVSKQPNPLPVPVRPDPNPAADPPDPVPTRPDPTPVVPDPMPLPPNPTPIPAEPEPLPELSIGHLKKINFHLDEAKTLLTERDPNTARTMIRLAKQIAEEKRTGPHTEKIERMAMLTEFVGEFWSAVDNSIRDLAGQDLDVGSTVVHIQAVSQASISYRMAGRNFRKSRHEWPAGLVRAIAERWLEKEPQSSLFVGAFMAVEPRYGVEKGLV
ncbi:MAG: hypothetical protein VB835_11255 [Pirellulales bacterium]